MTAFRSLRATAASTDGFTLVEVMVSALILTMGVLSTLLLLDQANATTSTNRAREGATNLARELTEATRSIDYAQVTTPSLPAFLQRQPGLEDAAAAGGYTIRRRGFTYEIALASCVMDDARDGGGDQSGGGFCPDSVAANTPNGTRGPDRNPEDYKRVTATVSWTEKGVARRATQTAVINNPGSAGGPAIRTLALRKYGNPPPQLTLGREPDQVVEIDFTTTTRPATATWLLDGTLQRPAPVSDASGRTWSVSWNYSGLVDGTYVVGAEAGDRFGVSGPGRSLTVKLNRFKPVAPQQLAGGRNRLPGARVFVELEWTANVERDIEGYEVWRRGSGGPDQKVCGLQTATTCLDPNPPATGTLAYYVVAWDRDENDHLRPGDPSALLPVTDTNLPPNPVTNLVATANGNGSTTLTWSQPTPDDRNPGDSVVFYRVYRDGQAVGDRYARWYDNAASVKWTDPRTDGLPHDYYVTAVDDHFAESQPVGVRR